MENPRAQDLPNRENQRRTLTRRLVREGLMRLLTRKGIRDITVSELAREAGINRATFYRNYTSPYDVLEELEREVVGGFTASLASAGGTSAESSFRNQIRALCEAMYGQRDAMRLIIRNDTDPQFAANLFRFPKNQHLIERFMPVGLSDDERRLAGTFFVTGAYCLMRQWLMENVDMTPDQAADLLTSCLVDGIANVRPRTGEDGAAA